MNSLHSFHGQQPDHPDGNVEILFGAMLQDPILAIPAAKAATGMVSEKLNTYLKPGLPHRHLVKYRTLMVSCLLDVQCRGCAAIPPTLFRVGGELPLPFMLTRASNLLTSVSSHSSRHK